MRSLILGGLFLALSASGLFAADLKSGSNPTPVTTNVWQGFYVGVGVGGIFDYHEIALGGEIPTGASAVGSDGWTGSLVGGYDLTLSNWLIGAWIEGTLEQSNTKIGGVSFNANNSWAVGGRAGYLIASNLLVYGKLGYTMEDYSANVTGTHLGALSGATYGGGLEYALSSALFFRTEYRRDDYRSVSLGALNGSDYVYDNRLTVGLSYKFNGGNAPWNILPANGFIPLK